jgi:hypothetical protein
MEGSPHELDSRGLLDRLEAINAAWREGRPRDMGPFLHVDVIMRVPGWAGRVQGREAFMDGFVDFCDNARLLRYEEAEPTVDVVAGTGLVSYAFSMEYELDGQRYLSTGRDLWAFQRETGEWLAVWRTMLDLTDEMLVP